MSLNGLHSLYAWPKYVSPMLIIFGVGFRVLDLLPDLVIAVAAAEDIEYSSCLLKQVHLFCALWCLLRS